MKPRSHRVAQAAFDCVDARKNAGCKKAYGALAHKFPVLILQNGLAQATGFLLAKASEKRPEFLLLLDDVAQVLRDTGEAGCADSSALHKSVIAADMMQTMHLTRRTLEVAGWIKRYVQGVLKVDATGETIDQKDAA